MKSIGFKNFRRFQELKPIQLAPITFFVGGNNAGKSTVTKAMMLMQENIKRQQERTVQPLFQLGSDKGHDVHVGTFGRALHKPYPVHPDPREIEIRSKIGEFVFKFVIGGDVESQRLNADILLTEIKNLEMNWSFAVDYKKNLATFLYPQSLLDNFLDMRNRRVRSTTTPLTEEDSREEIQRQIAQLEDEIASEKREIQGFNEIYQAIRAREIKEKESKVRFLKKQLTAKQTVSKDAIVKDEVVLEGYQLNPMSKMIISYEKTSREARSHYEEKGISSSTRAMYEEAIFLSGQKSEMAQTLFREVKDTIAQFSIVSIPSHAVCQKVFFSREDRNDYMSSVFGEYLVQDNKYGGDAHQFVQDWMHYFGIGSDFKIEPIQGEAFTVTITNMNGNDVPLADLGMGSIQLILLLLKLATLIVSNDCNNVLILIEEPEQNIHPKLQSKLAELFAYVNQEYGFRFLVETHSEYLIRKTQAMIANEGFDYQGKKRDIKFEKNPFRVYYFPEDGEPYDMVYQRSGMFENKFDEGFFDEASRQHVVVIKKARELQ